MSDCAEKVAIITGASRGIGLSVAQRLAASGVRVCLTALDHEELRHVVEDLGPERAVGFAGHAEDIDHRRHVLDTVMTQWGRIDILVNNVGTSPPIGPLADLDLDAARQAVDVNCLTPLAWIQAVHRRWMAEHGGSIVNVASIIGQTAAPGIGFYGATKAMLIRLTAQLAYELGPQVRVNAVAPALVKTAFSAALYQANEPELAARYPMKRLGMPDDIAGSVAFLASHDASWITGQALVIDGGVTLAGGGL